MLKRNWTITSKSVYELTYIPKDPSGPTVHLVPCAHMQRYYYVLIEYNGGQQIIPSFLSYEELKMYFGFDDDIIPLLDEWEVQ